MSISSAAGAGASPLQRLLGTISSQASAGSLGAADATALSGAVTDIDATLGADRAAGTGARLAPKDMKDRIDGLIDGQVEAGALTSDQAAELKEIFAQNAPGARGGPEGATGRSGPPPGPPPGGPQSGQDGGAGGSTGTDASGSRSLSDLLQSFIAQLREGRSGKGYDSLGYDSLGGANGATAASSLLVDFRT